MSESRSFTIRTALIVALGGFLMGFDASVISGVVGFIELEFALGTDPTVSDGGPMATDGSAHGVPVLVDAGSGNFQFYFTGFSEVDNAFKGEWYS